MKLRALGASTLLLASVLAGAPGALAAPAAVPTGTNVAAAPSDDQSGTDGISKGTKEWVCRNLGIWCD